MEFIRIVQRFDRTRAIINEALEAVTERYKDVGYDVDPETDIWYLYRKGSEDERYQIARLVEDCDIYPRPEVISDKGLIYFEGTQDDLREYLIHQGCLYGDGGSGFTLTKKRTEEMIPNHVIIPVAEKLKEAMLNYFGIDCVYTEKTARVEWRLCTPTVQPKNSPDVVMEVKDGEYVVVLGLEEGNVDFKADNEELDSWFKILVNQFARRYKLKRRDAPEPQESSWLQKARLELEELAKSLELEFKYENTKEGDVELLQAILDTEDKKIIIFTRSDESDQYHIKNECSIPKLTKPGILTINLMAVNLNYSSLEHYLVLQRKLIRVAELLVE